MDDNVQSNEVIILKELHKNARASLTELSEKTGLTRQTIAKTINKLERAKKSGAIQQYLTQV